MRGSLRVLVMEDTVEARGAAGGRLLKSGLACGTESGTGGSMLAWLDAVRVVW